MMNETRKEFRSSATMVLVRGIVDSRSNVAGLASAVQDRIVNRRLQDRRLLAAGKMQVTALTGAVLRDES